MILHSITPHLDSERTLHITYSIHCILHRLSVFLCWLIMSIILDFLKIALSHFYSHTHSCCPSLRCEVQTKQHTLQISAIQIQKIFNIHTWRSPGNGRHAWALQMEADIMPKVEKISQTNLGCPLNSVHVILKNCWTSYEMLIVQYF